MIATKIDRLKEKVDEIVQALLVDYSPSPEPRSILKTSTTKMQLLPQMLFDRGAHGGCLMESLGGGVEVKCSSDVSLSKAWRPRRAVP